MHNIRTLHPSGTELEFPVGEDNISKRGYITTCKHTLPCGRNVKGDSQRERGVWCFRTALKNSSSVYTELMLYMQVFGKNNKSGLIHCDWTFGL